MSELWIHLKRPMKVDLVSNVHIHVDQLFMFTILRLVEPLHCRNYHLASKITIVIEAWQLLDYSFHWL